MVFLWASLLAAGSESPGWERQHLGDYVSEPGEPLEIFLKRLGLVLDAHTKATGHEACGMIGWQASTERHAVALFTDGVQRGCSMRYSEVPTGFETTRETIHSHPYATLITLTAADRAWNRAHNDMMHGSTINIKPGFSQGDFDAGPGWLVFQGTLQYQRGWGRVRRFGRLDAAATTPVLLKQEPTLALQTP
jgi:hypothetical protein